MYGILSPREATVEYVPPTKRGLEAATASFLKQARRAALVRFEQPRLLFNTCLTVHCAVPARSTTEGGTGAIIAHVSPPLLKAWMMAAYGNQVERRAHVMAQLALVLQDLSDHDLHVQLALTDAQRDAYDDDLGQLVTESLSRTTFSHLGKTAKVHWEGTMVRSLKPPFLLLVVSIGC